MPIIIKEIQVKTTVEKRISESQMDPQSLVALKKMLMRELQASNRLSDNKRKKDR